VAATTVRLGVLRGGGVMLASEPRGITIPMGQVQSVRAALVALGGLQDRCSAEQRAALRLIAHALGDERAGVGWILGSIEGKILKQ
jgi:hypothetical protein